jgi:hypothetical protein
MHNVAAHTRVDMQIDLLSTRLPDGDPRWLPDISPDESQCRWAGQALCLTARCWQLLAGVPRYLAEHSSISAMCWWHFLRSWLSCNLPTASGMLTTGQERLTMRHPSGTSAALAGAFLPFPPLFRFLFVILHRLVPLKHGPRPCSQLCLQVRCGLLPGPRIGTIKTNICLDRGKHARRESKQASRGTRRCYRFGPEPSLHSTVSGQQCA